MATRYERTAKTIFKEALALSEKGVDNPLAVVLRRRKLRLVEKFTFMDSELVRDFQVLLYFKSRIPDLLFTYSMDKEKLDEVHKMIDIINSAISSVKKAVEEIENTEFYDSFVRNRRAAANDNAQQAQQQTENSAESPVENAEQEQTVSQPESLQINEPIKSE